MMLEKITDALKARSDLKAWSVQQVNSRSVQQYEMPGTTEAVRSVDSEKYTVTVLRETPDAEGKPGCGEGVVTILPGADLGPVLDEAALIAGMIHNPPYDFPGKAPVPGVELADPALQADPKKELQLALEELKSTTETFPQVRLTAAECFAEESTVHFVNNKGMEAEQTGTSVHLEWVFIAGSGEGEVETFAELERRRFLDLNLKQEVAQRARYTTDLLSAGPAPTYAGPVIIRGGTLGNVIDATVLKILSSGRSKFTGESPWEVGQPIFKEDVRGDAITLFANRKLPYGTRSNRCDGDGIPAQRLTLVKENALAAFTANQQYAEYLGIPATGGFGNIELQSGTSPAAELLAGDYLEASEFSWFNANPISGDFACEIRLGYVVKGGVRKPFKGGLLVGSILTMLTDVDLSKETGFYGFYTGPTTVRFNQLKVAGQD